MRKEIERRKCDQCEKVVDQSDIMIGGSPFQGWLEVKMTNGSTRMSMPDCGPWDFCSAHCCIAFLRKEDK
jgi:hypothetical protein